MADNGYPGRMSRSPWTRLRKYVAETGLVRPPSLQTDEERSASRLELFFDLAFVLVVAELASGLGKDLTPRGVLIFAGLFTAVWWSWVSATLFANRFDHDDVVYRGYKLASMLAVVGMAATATEAVGAKSALFASCYIALRLLLISQYARAYRHVAAARRGIRLYLVGTGTGALLWALSLALPTPVRYWLWAAGILVEIVIPLLATAAHTDVPLHLEHLPERFSLFIILVLGESVAAIAHGVHDAQWNADAVTVAVISFVLTAGLWWSYFDLAGAGAKRLLAETDSNRSSVTHDTYIYGQLPLTLALAAIGVGIEHVILESTRDHIPTGTRTLLAGGLAVYLAAVGITNTGMARTWRSGWWAPVAAALVALANLLLALPAVVVVSVLAALLVSVVVVGTVQETRGRIDLERL
jgi:low temperature requirement protein LtrA